MKTYQIDKSKFLSPKEITLLLETLKRLEPKHERDCLAIELLLETGARASELLQLEVKDLNDESMSVLLKGLKGSNDREIPLKRALFLKLKKHIDASRIEGAIFSFSYKRLFQIWKEICPFDKKLHSLRHTFAIEKYKKTRDIRVVQFALGHKSIINTMVYADYVFKTEELRKILL